MSESEWQSRPYPELSDERLERARAIFRAWMQKWDYFAEGAPRDCEVDAFLKAIINSTGPKHNAI